MGLFTITVETARGYRVVLLRSQRGRSSLRVAQSRECVRPGTARRYGVMLVRSAIGDPRGQKVPS
jgi:hypothetical protein